MGNVARQSILSSISAYLGVLIGYLNIIILMPKFMTPEEIGLFRTIVAIAMLLVPFAFFGSGSATIKFYPIHKDNIPRLLGFLTVCIIGAFSVVALVSYLFQEQIFSLFEDKAARINEYFIIIFLLLILMVIYGFFAGILRANYAIVIPNFLTDFLYKALNGVLIIMLGYGILTFDQYLEGHVVVYIALCLIIGYIVITKFKVRFSLKGIFQKSFYAEVLNFTSFSFLSSFGIILVFQIDQIMVSQMLGLAPNGIYTTAMFMGLVIEMPRKYVGQIMHPYISDDIHQKMYKKLNKDYREAGNILLWVGGILLILLLTNLNNIYAIMPNGDRFIEGLHVVYIVGLTKLMTSAFSMNTEIISVSKYFKVNVALILVLGAITILTNLYFIPIFGIEGAALASLISLFLFNLIKFLLLRSGYGISPFSWKSLHIILFLVISYLLITLIPQLSNVWIDTLLRVSVTGLLVIASIYTIRPSENIVNTVAMVIARFRRQSQ